MLNIRTILLSVVLVLFLTLTIRLMPDRTAVVSEPEIVAVSLPENQGGSANQKTVAETRSIRYRTGEEFDVPLSERGLIRKTANTLALPYRSHFDQNFDVPLSERARILKANTAPSRSYRSTSDEDFDVPLSERARYLNDE